MVNLHVKLNRLSLICNANEQYSRKYNLRVGGIKEEPGEDCYEAISSFFSNEMGVTIDDMQKLIVCIEWVRQVVHHPVK
jgi:hypothetical protein